MGNPSASGQFALRIDASSHQKDLSRIYFGILNFSLETQIPNMLLRDLEKNKLRI